MPFTDLSFTPGQKLTAEQMTTIMDNIKSICSTLDAGSRFVAPANVRSSAGAVDAGKILVIGGDGLGALRSGLPMPKYQKTTATNFGSGDWGGEIDTQFPDIANEVWLLNFKLTWTMLSGFENRSIAFQSAIIHGGAMVPGTVYHKGGAVSSDPVFSIVASRMRVRQDLGGTTTGTPGLTMQAVRIGVVT